MTGNTVADKSRMIYRSWHPAAGAMAGIALCSCWYMRGWLTGSNYIVMTAGAHTNNLRVVDAQRRRLEGGWTGGVAGVAQIGAVDMGGGFADGKDIVVTTGTGTNHL